jgi:hypothetical protein
MIEAARRNTTTTVLFHRVLIVTVQHLRMICRRTLFPFLACPMLAGMPAPLRAADIVVPQYAVLAGIAVPAERARLLATFPLGEATASALAFAADLPEGTRDLVAVTGLGLVLALELLSWHGEDGSRLQTRLSAVPDRQRLRLERNASARRGHGTWHEAWTDYLAWQGGAPMTDAPVRPVLAGTWQAGLAAQRAGTRTMLVVGPRGVPPGLVASCRPPRFFT